MVRFRPQVQLQLLAGMRSGQWAVDSGQWSTLSTIHCPLPTAHYLPLIQALVVAEIADADLFERGFLKGFSRLSIEVYQDVLRDVRGLIAVLLFQIIQEVILEPVEDFREIEFPGRRVVLDVFRVVDEASGGLIERVKRLELRNRPPTQGRTTGGPAVDVEMDSRIFVAGADDFVLQVS